MSTPADTDFRAFGREVVDLEQRRCREPVRPAGGLYERWRSVGIGAATAAGFAGAPSRSGGRVRSEQARQAAAEPPGTGPTCTAAVPGPASAFATIG